MKIDSKTKNTYRKMYFNISTFRVVYLIFRDNVYSRYEVSYFKGRRILRLLVTLHLSGQLVE